MALNQIIENSLYFLVLINPVSKILFLTSKKPAYSRQELLTVSLKATLVALFILLVLSNIGDFLLVKVFHIDIYSLSVAGGIILFTIGLTAVRKGKFFEANKATQRLADISIVPLATPLIAGPGTMTAAITFASLYGMFLTSICITLAILVNLFFMLLSRPISHALKKINATGPIIRIAGLIVTAVATQMIFSGSATWIRQII